MASAAPVLREVALDDKYALDTGRVYLTGVQALVRLLILQHQRDRLAGLATGGFVSGYRGSPLGGLDQALWKASRFLERASVRFQPGLNEDLAATSIWGTQQLNLHPGAKADADRPRFDFYKILPGGEEPKVQGPKPPAPDRLTADKAAGRIAAPPQDAAPAKPGERTAALDPSAAAPKAADRFWLQAGSFASEADADNLKARLALAGWEAQVQKGDVPEKGTRYRVRLGPYDDTGELNRAKGELARRGFDVAVIRY